MSEARFNVVVSGAVLDGFELGQVKEEFSKLFSLAEAKTDHIFAKGDVVIKKNVAETTAHKFLRALERIGAAAHLLPLSSEQVAPTPLAGLPAKEESLASEGPSIAQPNNAVEATNYGGVGEQSAVAKAPQGSSQPFAFYGNGSEYFRIWIVNILLTIATLGIYSAWAKVRNAQYFYGHSEVSGSRFAYHAKPLTILKGRIIAVVLFVIYSAVSNMFPSVGIVLALLLFAALPWIVIRSLKFNRRMTAWRNIRFGFDGEFWPAVKVFILWPLAGVFTLGLLIPVALYKQNEFIINNTRYGTAKFRLTPCGTDFFVIYLIATGILIGAGIVAWLVGLLFAPLSGVALLVAYLYMFVFISVRSANLIYNNSQLSNGDFGFSCSWADASYFKLVFVNSLFTLLTLGLYIPWAKVRFAAYKAEHLELLTSADLDGFVAGEEENVTALGDELGDVFDMEVGL